MHFIPADNKKSFIITAYFQNCRKSEFNHHSYKSCEGYIICTGNKYAWAELGSSLICMYLSAHVPLQFNLVHSDALITFKFSILLFFFFNFMYFELHTCLFFKQTNSWINVWLAAKPRHDWVICLMGLVRVKGDKITTANSQSASQSVRQSASQSLPTNEKAKNYILNHLFCIFYVFYLILTYIFVNYARNCFYFSGLSSFSFEANKSEHMECNGR